MRIPFDGDWYVVVDDSYPNTKTTWKRQEVIKSNFNDLNYIRRYSSHR